MENEAVKQENLLFFDSTITTKYYFPLHTTVGVPALVARMNIGPLK